MRKFVAIAVVVCALIVACVGAAYAHGDRPVFPPTQNGNACPTVSSSPNYQLESQGFSVISMAQWKIQKAEFTTVGSHLEIQRLPDKQTFDANGTKTDLKFDANGTKTDLKNVLAYYGYKKPAQLVGTVITSGNDTWSLERSLARIVLTGSPAGQKLVKTLALQLIHKQEGRLPNGVELTVDYFGPYGLDPIFRNRLATYVQIESKRKFSLELPKPIDQFNTRVKCPQSDYLVLVSKTGRQRVIISAANPAITWDITELSDEEIEAVHGTMIGEPDRRHEQLEKAAEIMMRQ